MAEYIDRNKFIHDIENRYCKPCENEGKDYKHAKCKACWVGDMIGEIEEQKTTHVSEVRRGKWIKSIYFPDKDLYFFICNSCLYGCLHSYNNEPVWEFCPNCGAKMELGE